MSFVYYKDDNGIEKKYSEFFNIELSLLVGICISFLLFVSIC